MEMRPGCLFSVLAALLLPIMLLFGACSSGTPSETTAPETEQTNPPETVKLTFQPVNGDASMVIDAVKGTVPENVPTPTKRACKFLGWYVDEELWDGTKAVEKDLVLTAKWTLAEDAFQKDPNAGNRAEGTQLRVCSFNTLLPTVGKKVPVAGRDTGLFNMVSEYKPDVIAFQEFNAEWCDGFRSVFAGTDYRLISGDSSAVNGKTVNCTLAYNAAVLTLVEYDSFPYAVSDSTTSRVVTWAVFETKDDAKQRFIATTTHWALTEEQRLEEAKELAKWIQDAVAKYKIPVIAMGDYNARDVSFPYTQLMKQASLQDAKYTAPARGLVGLTHHSRKVSSYNDEKINLVASIDHIFYTEGVEALYYDTVLNEEIMTTSDHNPIYADLRFTPVT